VGPPGVGESHGREHFAELQLERAVGRRLDPRRLALQRLDVVL
jgi:hypothetical protein